MVGYIVGGVLREWWEWEIRVEGVGIVYCFVVEICFYLFLEICRWWGLSDN